jgi:amidohydrolase
MSATDTATAAISQASAELLALSHLIHAHPELGYQEHVSSRAVADVIEGAGFETQRGTAGLETAFTATRGHGSLKIAFCAEYDALPVVGHACGHNIIAAASTGAAIGLGAVADELDVTVVLFGTPSEEGGGGKIDLLNAGCFADVHAAMMVHPWPVERATAHCLAVDHFDVCFGGKEAHASAAPWEGVNALDAWTVSHVALGLLRQQLRRHDQFHGILLEGGSAANIIPSRVVGRYMARSDTTETLATLRSRIDACFAAGAMATGATVAFTELGHQFSEMRPDAELLAHYRTAATALGRSFALDDQGVPVPTISTDMANVSLAVPSIHPLIGIDAGGAVNHQPAFAAACVTPSADAAVLDGANALAHTAIAVANDDALRRRLLARTT